MAAVVPRSKKRRTLNDPHPYPDPLDFHSNPSTTASNTMIVHHQPPHPPHHQQYQAGPSSSSLSSRSTHPMLSTVSEVIGGKIQQVYVLDDDSPPPPPNPLSVQTATRDAHLSNNYTYVNPSLATSDYTSRDYANSRHLHPQQHQHHHPFLHSNGIDLSSSTKGKRKAQASVQPLGPETHLNVVPHDADLIAPAPNHLSAPHPAPVPKRRKRSHPVQPVIAAPATNSYGTTLPAATCTSTYNAVQTKRRPIEVATAHIEPNYRGGYPAAPGTLDYVARYDPAANAAASNHRVYDGTATASARDSYTSSTGASYPMTHQPNLPVDDKEGHIIVREGEYVTSRYKILGQLGQGTFGKVVECYDRKQRKYVAIKIIRAIQKYRDASQIEIRVLKTLREHDPSNQNKCIHLLDTFTFKNHVCIVSELLGKSVFDFLKENNFNPFPTGHIWSFAKQLLKSVAFLHSLNLVHTDLKPENILLVNSEYQVIASSRRSNAKRRHVLNNTEIRLIDFGSATFNDEYHSAVVSTRHYRAPEIILQMGWSFACDVWSIGCILIEFFTGDALFQTHDNLEHLAMMEAVLGVMPDNYRRKAETYKPELFRAGQLNFPNSETQKQSRKYVRQMKKLQDIIQPATAQVAFQKHNSRFLDLLRKLLEFDPNKRIKVSEALNHPYFDLEPRDFPP